MKGGGEIYGGVSIVAIFAFLAWAEAVNAADRVAVIPLLGGAVGNATAADVVKGKTFSSRTAGKGATGTLELPPCVQIYTNSIGMIFHLLPQGGFTMGSPDSEPGREDDETQHAVQLHGFYMQITEVTQKQWQDIIGNNPATSNIGDEYPIETVNWFEAAWFSNALSQTEGRSRCYDMTGCSPIPGNGMTCSDVTIVANCTGYRLSTEAQWEYAAWATTTTAWPYTYSYDYSIDPGQVTGSDFNSNLAAMGWYFWNNALPGGYLSGTKPVAKKQPNKWGLFDMQGNVWEWCQDWYGDYPSGGGISRDPQGPATGFFRVARGGHWQHSANYSRSAERGNDFPLVLVQLRMTGSCTVSLHEELFDMDGPGHYFRRIKNVAITIPCVTGPYVGVNCKLTLLKSSIRRVPTVSEEGGYARGEEDGRFIDYFGATESIVASGSQNDSGLFETNLRDERYLPFEGAGTISEWRLELPANPANEEPQQFDYDTISDIILHIRYTARDGGEPLRNAAMDNLNEVISQGSAAGSTRLFSIRHEFPQAWARFTSHTQGEDGRCELAITLRPEHYPFWSQGYLNDVVAVDLLAYSTREENIISVYDQEAIDNEQSKHDDLKKDRSLNGLFVGKLSEAPKPDSPTGELKIYFDNVDLLKELWLAITWSS